MRRPDIARNLSLHSGRNPARLPTRTLATGLVLAALAGCAVGPTVRTPGHHMPENYNATAVAQTDATAPIQKEWWTLFQDPILNDLVTKALSQNFGLQAAVARVEEAEGLSREAGAVFFPDRPERRRNIPQRNQPAHRAAPGSRYPAHPGQPQGSPGHLL